MSHDLLVTKLYPPPARKNLVPRLHLIQILNQAWQQGKKLTLVSASAGYGKTTLVTEWLATLTCDPSAIGRAEEVGSAWLSLDKADNDPARFLAYLIAALQQIDASIGKNTLALLNSPQPLHPEIVLTTLVNEIAGVPSSFILVLDDYHVIESLLIHQQLAFLVEHPPPQMHLVIITREDPPLPLARLRARGQMVEIRQETLRFSAEECADFLQRLMGLQLAPNDISALEHRTEGWIAGLQLAALSMQGRTDLPGFVTAFTGSSHYVLDYLIEEVFERQPSEVQDFLLKTCTLERLSGPLCDRVTGRTGSAGLLDRLEHANLFIIPLDQSRTWYRYHHLFAELLRQRLHASAQFSANELHALASQWFADEDLLPEAIHHALAALDWNRAAELISANSVALFRRGELITLLGWLKALPEEVITTHPQLCRDFGWALALTGQLDPARSYLESAERAVLNDDTLLGQVLVAQAYLARARGDYPQAIALSKRALAFIAEADILHRSLVTFTLGFAYFNSGNLAEAEPALLEACQAARMSENDYARLTALGLLGAIQKERGRLHRAAEFCRQALHEAQGAPTAAQAQVFLATILYEWNDLAGAADHLAQAIKSSKLIGNRAIQADGYRALAHLKQAQGELSAASEALCEFDQILQDIQSPLQRAAVASYHVEFSLAQGDVTAASLWAAQMAEGINPAGPGPQYDLTQARLLLAQGKPASAGEILARLYEQVSQAGLHSLMIEVRAMQALATANPSDALHFLEASLRKAQPEGFIRTFVDKGAPMKALLERLRVQGGELREYILKILAAFGEAGRAYIPQPLIEPLSARELEVLRLLEKGLSNGEIARRLIVTVGTVKTHVHSVLNKLGVQSRTQAVAQAKEFKLL